MDDLTSAIDALIHEADLDAAGPWAGPAPLHFTSGYQHPDDLDAAYARYQFEHNRFACSPRSHMWHRAICGGTLRLDHHALDTFTADLRCPPDAHPRGTGPCVCVGDLIHMTVCANCRWHAIGAENDTVEAWHDHAFPGWRDLPILPDKLRGTAGKRNATGKLDDWLTAHYPDLFRVPGAPVRTQRSGLGTRHVPAHSPYGGYDLAVLPPTAHK